MKRPSVRKLPAELVIPQRLVLTPKSLARVGKLVKKPRKPNKALRDLMAGKPVPHEPETW
jgi:hypothetical protein